MGEKTDRMRRAISESSVVKWTAWLGLIAAVVVTIGYARDAIVWAASKDYETKADADRAHLQLKVHVDDVRDEHNADRRMIQNTRENLFKLMGRFSVEPERLPEDP